MSKRDSWTDWDWWLGRKEGQLSQRAGVQLDKLDGVAKKAGKLGWTLTIGLTLPLVAIVFLGPVGFVLSLVVAAVYFKVRKR